MAFFMLDTGILRSSLWRAAGPVAKVFITALINATPCEFKHPVDVFDLDGKPTGWQVPPGWYGFVEGSWAALLDDAKPDTFDDGVEALRCLGAEDPRSSSPAFGGRRLVRVDGGLVVLRYDHFAGKDHSHSNAQRCRDYRQRKKETRASTGLAASPNSRRPAAGALAHGDPPVDESVVEPRHPADGATPHRSAGDVNLRRPAGDAQPQHPADAAHSGSTWSATCRSHVDPDSDRNDHVVDHVATTYVDEHVDLHRTEQPRLRPLEDQRAPAHEQQSPSSAAREAKFDSLNTTGRPTQPLSAWDLHGERVQALCNEVRLALPQAQRSRVPPRLNVGGGGKYGAETLQNFEDAVAGDGGIEHVLKVIKETLMASARGQENLTTGKVACMFRGGGYGAATNLWERAQSKPEGGVEYVKLKGGGTAPKSDGSVIAKARAAAEARRREGG